MAGLAEQTDHALTYGPPSVHPGAGVPDGGGGALPPVGTGGGVDPGGGVVVTVGAVVGVGSAVPQSPGLQYVQQICWIQGAGF
ncbi:MAG: hypothetical protein Q8L37_04000 [Candidatus Gottesmanbacteria bacterium]|nr:hypothetical protein [Candidatus Gottesmanbacteria bacterium]